MTITLEKTSFIDSVKESIPSHKVYVFCKSGTMPLEWPKKQDGTRSVDDDQIVVLGNGKAVVTGRERYRNIDTRITDDAGRGGQSAGFQVLDMNIPEDVEFLERIKDWIANSRDPRIEKHGVRVEEGSPFPMPFAGWDHMKPSSLMDFVALQLSDDHEQNLSLLKSYAQYELSRRPLDNEPDRAPRQEVLDGLELLAVAPGDESDDDALVED